MEGKGKLNLKEFTKMLKIIDESLTNDEIAFIFNIFDIDGDNSISFNEF